ncbi:MAG: glutamate 5-kinase, partial [Bdellovibrionales bacterium]|nr:glutamate 5-kinase [Bdellovibrionales bacterium]
MRKRIVIKCGTRVLVSGEQRLRTVVLEKLLEECARLQSAGYELTLVTSGAVALGLRHIQKTRKTASATERRAAASIGQTELLKKISDRASDHSLTFSQLLLSREDFEHRERFIQLKETMETLFSMGAVPLLNENDVTSLQAVGFRDNDHVAALAALLTESRAVFFLSSTDGLYRYEGGEPVERISEVESISEDIYQLVEQERDALSLGGMRSKLLSAQLAQQAGAAVWIVSGDDPAAISRALGGESVGTAVLPIKNPLGEQLSKRKAWIALVHEDAGSVVLDDGAVTAVTARSKSLLPVGIIEVRGEFAEGKVVSLLSSDSKVVGRGIINLSSKDLKKIVGMKSKEAGLTLKQEGLDEVINRDNLVVFP